jgi:hypothetical protein
MAPSLPTASSTPLKSRRECLGKREYLEEEGWGEVALPLMALALALALMALPPVGSSVGARESR